MKFFVDTGDIAEIRDLAATGLLDGVTTNPSLIAKSGRPFIPLIEEICGVVEGPVSAEVTATDYETMLKEQFITAVSHELRTPMTVIKGVSEIMLEQPDDARPNRKLLETLSRSANA